MGPGDGGVTNPGYVPDHDLEQLEYSAASPDEKALIEASAGCGVRFLGEQEQADGTTLARLLHARDNGEVRPGAGVDIVPRYHA